jgi:hypothetical protein
MLNTIMQSVVAPLVGTQVCEAMEFLFKIYETIPCLSAGQKTQKWPF